MKILRRNKKKTCRVETLRPGDVFVNGPDLIESGPFFLMTDRFSSDAGTGIMRAQVVNIENGDSHMRQYVDDVCQVDAEVSISKR